MRLLITWLLGVPASIVLLFNVFAVDPAVVFAPSSATLVSSVTSTNSTPANPSAPAIGPGIPAPTPTAQF
jgi:hypothetical protein